MARKTPIIGKDMSLDATLLSCAKRTVLRNFRMLRCDTECSRAVAD
jgi:hypothetical protein